MYIPQHADACYVCNYVRDNKEKSGVHKWEEKTEIRRTKRKRDVILQ
jgi:hypothetical protein